METTVITRIVLSITSSNRGLKCNKIIDNTRKPQKNKEYKQEN